MRKRRVIIISVSFLFFLFAGIIIYLDSVTNLSSIPKLEKRFNEYYQLEKAQNWEKAFTYRTPAIQKHIDKNHYISQMQKDSKGWELISYKANFIEKDNNKIKIHVNFKEIPSKEFIPTLENLANSKKGAIKTMTFSEVTIWKLIEGQWYCEKPGMRLHLTMNLALVISD